MAQAQGSDVQLVIDTETTYKTDPVSPDGVIQPFTSSSLKLTRALFESKAITNSRNPKKPGRGNYEISGDIGLEISPYMGRMLKHALGAVVNSEAPAPYTHTFKVGNLPVGMVLEVGYTDIAKYLKYNGCRVNSLKMTLGNEGIMEGSVNVLGAKETIGTNAYDATSTDLGHKPFDAFEATILEGGSSIAYVTSVDFELNNNLDGSAYVIGGAGERAALPAGMVKVSGTLKAFFQDTVLYAKAIAHTESSLKITLSRGTGLGAADNESLEILIPELVFEPVAPVVPGPQGVFVELPFVGYYDNSTETSSLQMILKNTQAAV